MWTLEEPPGIGVHGHALGWMGGQVAMPHKRVRKSSFWEATNLDGSKPIHVPTPYMYIFI